MSTSGSTSAKTPRSLRFLGIVFFNTVLLVSLLILLESVMDFLSYKRESQGDGQYDIEYRRRMLPPMFDGLLEADDFQKSVDPSLRRRFRLVTNKEGFLLGPSQYGERESLSACDILFTGGSTTECKYVDDSLRFPYRVASMLSAALGKRVVSLNGAMSGNNTYHSISNLVHAGLAYTPKVVVWMHTINDLAVLTKTGSYFNVPDGRRLSLKRSRPERPSYPSHLISKHFPNLTALIRQASDRTVRDMSESPRQRDEFAGYRSTHVDEDVILREFSKALATFHGICEANGIALVLMTQANRLDPGNADSIDIFLQHEGRMELRSRIGTYQRMNQLIRDYAKSHALTCVDLDKGIPHDSRYIYDQVHMNSEGSKLASRLIFESFLRTPSLLADLGGGRPR